MRQHPRIVILMICLAMSFPGIAKEPEVIGFWHNPPLANYAWYRCLSPSDRRCIRVTTEHGLDLRDAQIRSRQETDRRVLLDVIASLDSRIAELEAKIAALEETK